MKRKANLFERTIIYMIPVTIIFGVILYLITKNNNAEVKSLVIGSVLSMVLNYWHQTTTIYYANNKVEKLKKFTVLSSIIRYAIYALLIIVGTLFSDFNPIFMILGIALYPLIMIVLSLISKK